MFASCGLSPCFYPAGMGRRLAPVRKISLLLENSSGPVYGPPQSTVRPTPEAKILLRLQRGWQDIHTGMPRQREAVGFEACNWKAAAFPQGEHIPLELAKHARLPFTTAKAIHERAVSQAKTFKRRKTTGPQRPPSAWRTANCQPCPERRHARAADDRNPLH